MYVRHLLAAAGAGVVGAFGLAAPAAAHVSAHPIAASAYTLTPGRFWSLVGAVLGLAGIVIGGLALARAGRTRGAVVALVAGLAGAVIGGLVVAAADGGPGTGYGIVGGYVALVVGLVAMALGVRALGRSRSRRTG